MSIASGEPLYMGIDIESGKPGSPDARYSVAIIDSKGRLLVKSSGASLSRIIRLAWETRPEVIGVDNVFELAPDVSRLHKLFNFLPPDTRVIQVNVVDGQVLNLREVARLANIDIGSAKPNSMKTAYLVALLASKGFGTAVYMEEEKTIITVSRGRGGRKGGMSQARYQRRVRASVLHAAKKIQEILDREGIDYDVHFKGGRGGLDRATFIVYAPRRRLYGLIRPHRGINYTIRFRTIYGKKIVLGQQDVRSDKPIVVGIDPGIMVGIAILDLDGNVLYLGSGKSLDRGSLVEVISKYGRPIIVAVDTPEVPDAVKTIAAKFQASIYSPSKSLQVSEKSELARQALGGRSPGTQHERDALAAAYKALSALQSKLSQIDSYLAKIDIDIDYDRVKEAVLRGSTLAEAVEAELQRILSDEMQEVKREERIADQRVRDQTKIDSLLGRIDELTARIKVLEQRNKDLLEKIKFYEAELSRCKQQIHQGLEQLKDREIERLKNAMRVLQEDLRSKEDIIEKLRDENRFLLKNLVMVSKGEKVLVRTLSSLTMASIRRLEREQGALRPGEVLYVDNEGTYELEAIKYISKAGILAVLLNNVETNLSNSLRKFRIPTFRLEEYSPVKVGDYILVNSKVVDDSIAERERVEKERRIDLVKIVEEYRRERRKNLRKTR